MVLLKASAKLKNLISTRDEMYKGLLYIVSFAFLMILFEFIFFLIIVEPTNKKIIQDLFGRLGSSNNNNDNNNQLLNQQINQQILDSNGYKTANFIETNLDNTINLFGILSVVVFEIFLFIICIIFLLQITNGRLSVLFLAFVSVIAIAILELLLFYHVQLSKTPYQEPNDNEIKYTLYQILLGKLLSSG
jgi:hypothetical protein